MNININEIELRDKIYACWLGKNIGGTMGGPYEGRKEMLDITGFSTPENVVLPNDDLDLQLVWLEAVKRVGAKGITPQVLGEFWLSYVTPYWNEYGRCKTNMMVGILPPLSGDAFNDWKHSNGGWIRTEIWACLAPGAPDVATRYAYMDASVDHGGGEGTLAAMFVAALESAAFVEKDVRKLIEIGLSKIPEDSRVAQSVRFITECYDKGLDYRETRNMVLKMNEDIGTGWFEAPSNIAYAVIGLLWGEGDFKKSLIYTVNCGDDTDCTAGMVGSILGIAGGSAVIPKDWKKHIGDDIATVAIATGVLYGTPKTCEELADTVLKYTTPMLIENNADVTISDEPTRIDDDIFEKLKSENRDDMLYYPFFENSFRVDFNYASAVVIYEGEPAIKPGETKKVKIRFINNVNVYGNMQYYIKIKVLSTDGMDIRGPKSVLITRNSPFDVDFYHDRPYADTEYEITAGESVEAVNKIVLEVAAEGRISTGYIPLTFMGV